jgi:hypothetical protein
MANFKDDELGSQGERLNALSSVVDTVLGGMAGSDFRRGTSSDTKVALQKGKQSLARDIVGRRRRAHERKPVLPDSLQKRYKELLKFLGPATIPLVPFGMLAHYTRALDALDSLGALVDTAGSHTARAVMLGCYAKQARQVAALAKAINVATHSQVMQLAIIAELRTDARQSGPTDITPGAEDWRQHALTLEAAADDGDEAEA